MVARQAGCDTPTSMEPPVILPNLAELAIGMIINMDFALGIVGVP
ncbi:hypothetical protein [Photobacterium aquae]|nr:hypothetical protein [Photobacterium aquae]